jgi:hypothetical protein
MPRTPASKLKRPRANSSSVRVGSGGAALAAASRGLANAFRTPPSKKVKATPVSTRPNASTFSTNGAFLYNKLSRTSAIEKKIWAFIINTINSSGKDNAKATYLRPLNQQKFETMFAELLSHSDRGFERNSERLVFNFTDDQLFEHFFIRWIDGLHDNYIRERSFKNFILSPTSYINILKLLTLGAQAQIKNMLTSDTTIPVIVQRIITVSTPSVRSGNRFIVQGGDIVCESLDFEKSLKKNPETIFPGIVVQNVSTSQSVSIRGRQRYVSIDSSSDFRRVSKLIDSSGGRLMGGITVPQLKDPGSGMVTTTGGAANFLNSFSSTNRLNYKVFPSLPVTEYNWRGNRMYSTSFEIIIPPVSSTVRVEYIENPYTIKTVGFDNTIFNTRTGISAGEAGSVTAARTHVQLNIRNIALNSYGKFDGDGKQIDALLYNDSLNRSSHNHLIGSTFDTMYMIQYLSKYHMLYPTKMGDFSFIFDTGLKQTANTGLTTIKVFGPHFSAPHARTRGAQSLSTNASLKQLKRNLFNGQRQNNPYFVYQNRPNLKIFSNATSEYLRANRNAAQRIQKLKGINNASTYISKPILKTKMEIVKVLINPSINNTTKKERIKTILRMFKPVVNKRNELVLKHIRSTMRLHKSLGGTFGKSQYVNLMKTLPKSSSGSPVHSNTTGFTKRLRNAVNERNNASSRPPRPL